MILLFGFYYLITKGGVLLPFHDAPEDVLLVYNINADTAKTLMVLGFVTLIVGIIYQIIKTVYVKHKNIKQKDNIIDLIVMIMLGAVIASGLITLRGYIYLGDELDSVGVNTEFGYSFVRTTWTLLIEKSSIVFLSASLLTSILIFVDPKTSNIIAYLLLFVAWSIFCFFVFIWAVFYGNWHWSTSELIANEPVMGRITVFLSNTMWLIWLLVPCVIAGIMLYKKKKNNA